MNLRICSVKADTLKERYQKIGDTKRATPIEVKYKLDTNILNHISKLLMLIFFGIIFTFRRF